MKSSNPLKSVFSVSDAVIDGSMIQEEHPELIFARELNSVILWGLIPIGVLLAMAYLTLKVAL